jgi:CheY-like chemotaxis protein
MKILVVDDSLIHQNVARKQLGAEHDLTVVGSYDEAQLLLGGGNRYGCDKTGSHDFDVVLCDLLMPTSGQMQGSSGRDLVGQEMPVGIFLALLAAKNGAKHVAVFTDSDHHQHPASACFDAFNRLEGSPDIFQIAGANLLLCNASWWITSGTSVEPEVTTGIGTDDSTYREVCPRFKRWNFILTYMMLHLPSVDGFEDD